jgi:hypothetical protein
MSRTDRRSSQQPLEDFGPSPLSRVLRIDGVEDGESFSLEAAASERTAMASLLDLSALADLRFAGTFHREGQGGLQLTGTLTAKYTQICVVSLEPIETEAEIPVAIEFWPAPRIEALAKTADEAASHGLLDWPEPIANGKIELGRPLYETFATAIDPYPRREGARFDWTEPEAEAEPVRADNPFSALSKLKSR